MVPRNVKIHLETYIQEKTYMLRSGCIYAHVIHMISNGYKKFKEDKFEKNDAYKKGVHVRKHQNPYTEKGIVTYGSMPTHM